MVHLARAVAVGLSAAVVAAPAHAADPPQQLLEEIPWKCSEEEVIVWGADRDLRVLPGQNAWIAVDAPDIAAFCGDYEEQIECPPGTAYLWVTRTRQFEVVLACYR